MQLVNGGVSRRVFRGRAARAQKAARIAGAAALVVTLGNGTALAECRRSGTGAVITALDLVPLATGSAISSIVASINAVNSSSLAQSSAFVASPMTGQQDVSGGGRWSRVVAGQDEIEVNTNVTGTVANGGGIVPNGTTSDSCNSTTRLNYVLTQAGLDVGRFKFSDGANVQWGFTAGYVDVDAKDRTPGLGTFSADNQVSFAGLYLALSKGNFSFDAQIRGDYYSLALSDVDNSLFDQPLTARGMAALANASYRFDLPNNWFVEPSIGFVFSQTDVNPLDVSAALDLPLSVTPSLTLPGTVQVGAINSAIGRASLRVGTTITTSTIAWQPFGTVSIFNEFADDVQTSVTTGPGSLRFNNLGLPQPQLSANATTERIGTYGHVGVGLAGVLLNTGWLGFVRGDYRFGDHIEAISVNAGLRYQFEPAKNADGDGSLKDDGHAKTPYNWSGFYVGASSGGIWGKQEWEFASNGARTSPAYNGFLVGGQIGYDLQIRNMVVGVEADYNWTNADGGESCPNRNFFSCATSIDRIGFVTGRFGFTGDRTLYYVKAGLAYSEIEARTQWNFAGNLFGVPWAIPDLTASDSKSVTGWVVGAGMEFAIDHSWSARGEILRYDLGSERFTVSSGSIVDVDTTGTIGRVGINYRFGHRGHDYGHDALK